MTIEIKQSMDLALPILHEAGEWLRASGKNPSKWWLPENMTPEFFLKYAEPEDFYVILVDNEPAAAAVFQFDERNQSWTSIDQKKKQAALYIHWLCVKRKFAKQGLPKEIVSFASKLAQEKNIKLLRADTNFSEAKLRKVYEDLGFTLIGTLKEDFRTTAFYQREI